MRFAPHKLSKVDGLLARYAGNEDKLLRLVRRKYVDPGKTDERIQLPVDEARRTAGHFFHQWQSRPDRGNLFSFLIKGQVMLVPHR